MDTAENLRIRARYYTGERFAWYNRQPVARGVPIAGGE
jgi:hypothetical protein